jgi:hypothetical protein
MTPPTRQLAWPYSDAPQIDLKEMQMGLQQQFKDVTQAMKSAYAQGDVATVDALRGQETALRAQLEALGRLTVPGRMVSPTP